MNLASKGITQETVQERYEMVGGLVRTVDLDEARYGNHVNQMLSSASSNATKLYEEYCKFVPFGDLPDDGSHFSHKVVHYVVDEDTFKNKSVKFCSKQVQDLVYQHLSKSNLDKLYFDKNMDGFEFEKVVLETLPRWLKLLYRPIGRPSPPRTAHSRCFDVVELNNVMLPDKKTKDEISKVRYVCNDVVDLEGPSSKPRHVDPSASQELSCV